MTTQATGAGPREVFSDARGASRMLRTSWHPEDAVVVLSVWEDRGCLATFRLPAGEVPDLVGVLARGLAGLATAPSTPVPTTGAFAAPDRDAAPAPDPDRDAAPDPAPDPAPVAEPGPESVLAQVTVRARSELTRGARRALDGIGHGALTLRDRLGRDS